MRITLNPPDPMKISSIVIKRFSDRKAVAGSITLTTINPACKYAVINYGFADVAAGNHYLWLGVNTGYTTALTTPQLAVPGNISGSLKVAPGSVIGLQTTGTSCYYAIVIEEYF